MQIVKNTTGGDGTFNFTATGPSSVSPQSITTVGGTGSVSVLVTAGNYTVTEGTLPAGWISNDLSLIKNVTVPINGTGTVTYNNTAQGMLQIVKNATGGDGTFNFTATGPSSVSPQSITTVGGTGSVSVLVTAGNYNVTEGALPAGWISNDPSLIKNVTVPINGTGTVTYSNTKLATIILVKDAKGGTGTFTFTATVLPSPISITTSGGTGSQTFANLIPGDYGTITENAQSGWTLDALAFTSALGTSTVSVDQSTGIATISVLAAGDTVTITYDNTAALTTRTQGFWATHMLLSDAVWFGGTVGGHTYPGLSASDQTIGSHLISDQGKLMGAFWSNIAQTSTGKGKDAKRTQLDQARMQLLQQLVAAILNNAAFGSSPSGPLMSIAQARTYFATGTLAQVQAAASDMAAFNESGDTGVFTPGIAANGKQAKDAANLTFWDTLP